MDKNNAQTKQWLDKCYEKSSPSRQMVEKCIHEFKRGRTRTIDSERSGRPRDVSTPEIIEKIYDTLLVDLKVKMCELAKAVGISIRSVVKILHEDSGMRNLIAKWVPHLLTIDQKRQRVRDSESCFDLFNCKPSDFCTK